MKIVSSLIISILIFGFAIGISADTTFDVVIPPVPAAQEKTIQAKAVITEVGCIYLPPAYTTSIYRVLFQVQDQDGKLIKRDAIKITDSQINANSEVKSAITNLGSIVNAMLIDYVNKMSTNSAWLK